MTDLKSLDGEKWKSLDDFPFYYISNFGRVIYYGKTEPRFLKLTKNNYGYIRLSFCNENGQKKQQIHRLVAILFLENPENKNEIDHIDGNTENNIYSNLRWTTHLENMNNKKCFNKLNEKYIYKNKNSYRVRMPTFFISKCFKTLEEAIIFRDLKVKELYKSKSDIHDGLDY